MNCNRQFTRLHRLVIISNLLSKYKWLTPNIDLFIHWNRKQGKINEHILNDYGKEDQM